MPNELTQQELDLIREEAEKLYPLFDINECTGPIDMEKKNGVVFLVRNTHIAALTRERERVKPVIEAANEMLHLHMCEQEGLQSGKPTFQQWCEAVDNLSNSLNNYKTINDEKRILD